MIGAIITAALLLVFALWLVFGHIVRKWADERVNKLFRGIVIHRLPLQKGDVLLVKLGLSGDEMGTDLPWIPTQEDIEWTKEMFDRVIPVDADVQVIIHHFGVEVEVIPTLETAAEPCSEGGEFEDAGVVPD